MSEKIKLEVGQKIINGKVCTLVGDSYWDEDGEFVELAIQPDFEINSPETAEWFFKKRLKIEADIHALKNNADYVEALAIVANTNKMIKKHSNRLNWLDLRFGHEIATFAKGELAKLGKRAVKTYSTIYGAISFRAAKEKFDIKNQISALEYLKTDMELEKYIITTESFDFKSLTFDQQQDIKRAIMRVQLTEVMEQVGWDSEIDEETKQKLEFAFGPADDAIDYDPDKDQLIYESFGYMEPTDTWTLNSNVGVGK